MDGSPEAAPAQPTAPPTDAPTGPSSASKRDLPPMCLACGQMLRPEDVKCPSCGAPVRGQRAAGRSTKLTVAGFLLLAIFLLTAIQSALLLVDADTFIESGGGILGGSVTITGLVTYPNGTGAPGVGVGLPLLAGNETPSATTDASGGFTLRGVPAGFNVVRFVHGNHTTLDVRVYAIQDQGLDVQLVPRAEGGDRAQRDDASYGTIATLAQVCGGILVAIALVILGGAVASYRRRSYAMALAAGIISLVATLFYLPAILLSVVALVLVVRSRSEFR